MFTKSLMGDELEDDGYFDTRCLIRLRSVAEDNAPAVDAHFNAHKEEK